MTPDAPRRSVWFRASALLAGPIAALAMVLLLPEAPAAAADAGGSATGLTLAGRVTAGLLAWMAIWWVTEAIDISATALLPLVVLPVGTIAAHGSAGSAFASAATPYANSFIALFLGGFLLALSMERWGLHRRIALLTLRVVGPSRRGMVAGFMAISAALSMWVSNTATAIMMLPIALSIIALADERAGQPTRPGAAGAAGDDNFALCLMLGIAYASSVGGIGTLIGTAPNAILAGFIADRYGVELGFARWLVVGVPLVAVFIPIIWLMLTRVFYPVSREPIPGGSAMVRRELAALGPVSRGEWATFVVFLLTVAAWITRPLLERALPGVTDAGIAIAAGLVLFAIPVDLSKRVFVMDWSTAQRVPWGVLILFGGGLSLAAAAEAHGVSGFVGHLAGGLAGMPTIVTILTVTAGVIFLTELTSNTAVTSALLPILAALAPVLGVSPLALLVPAAIAASCAFMMPVGTPPNAIVFGSGRVTIPQMCKAGLWLNLIGVGLVTALAYAVVIPLWGDALPE